MSREYYQWLKKNYKNKRYIQGRNFEYAVMRKLRKLGYYCIRKFGSKGYEDVVASKHGTTLFIQCKHSKIHDTKPQQFNLSGLIALASKYGGFAVFAGVRNRHLYFQVWQNGRWINAKMD